MYKNSILVLAAVASLLQVPLSYAVTLTVYADGPYEVWGGSDPLADVEVDIGGGTLITVPGYYDTPGSGYAFLGQANTTASFAADYAYIVIGTRSLFALDAVEIGGRALQSTDMVSGGNIHRPWQFDSEGNLIGSPLDYSHGDYTFGPPDALADDVGIPPGHGTAPGGPFEGYVTVSTVPLPAPIGLLGAGFLVLLGSVRRLPARIAHPSRVSP